MKSKGLFRGLLLMAIGAFVIYWAIEHSPRKLGKIIGNELAGSYTMSETWYYICLVVGTVIGILGVVRTFKSV